jgi:YfiH family protein
MKQIHSSVVLAYDRRDGEITGGGKREGDALWSASPGTGVAVRTADCVPILLAHRGSPMIAAVHAGWRGLAAGIVREAVRSISEPFGKEGVSGIVAAAGPCARGCCYEVGEETAEALHALPGAAAAVRKGVVPGKWFADLQAIALAALVEAGVSSSHAEGIGPCTVCSPCFHSFRREKTLTGRQLSFIYIYR